MMNKLLICFCCLVIIFAACDRARKMPEQIEFINDYQIAKQQAADKNQPLVLVFYSEDCPWCKMLDDSTFASDIVVGMANDFVFARFDVEKDTALAGDLGVTLYPSVVVFKPDGSEAARLAGYYPPADFFNEVQLYLQGSETLQDYLVRLEDDPGRTDYLLIIAEKYRNRSDWDKALEYYNGVLKLSSDNIDELEIATFEIAGIYAQKGEYPKAIAAYEDFIARYADSEKIEDARRRIPYCLAKNGDYEKALRLFEKYLTDYPDSRYARWVNRRITELKKILPEGI